MNCAKHPAQPAVAQCSACGAGMCSDCVSVSNEYGNEGENLCPSCLIQDWENYLADVAKRKRKTLTRLIVSIILYIFGVILFISFFTVEQNSILMLVLALIFCGIYTGITWRKAAKESHEDYERKHGVEYTVTSTGVYRNDGFWMKLVFFFIGTALGVVVTPIRVIIDAVTLSKYKKIRQGGLSIINEIRAMN